MQYTFLLKENGRRVRIIKAASLAFLKMDFDIVVGVNHQYMSCSFLTQKRQQMLKAPRLNPQTHISRSYEIDLTEGH